MSAAEHLPTLTELEQLCELCSPREWEILVNTHGFLEVIATTLSQTEAFMSQRLGRKISIGGIKNPGDEQL